MSHPIDMLGQPITPSCTLASFGRTRSATAGLAGIVTQVEEKTYTQADGSVQSYFIIHLLKMVTVSTGFRGRVEKHDPPILTDIRNLPTCIVLPHLDEQALLKMITEMPLYRKV